MSSFLRALRVTYVPIAPKKRNVKECCKEPWQFALRSLGLLKSTFQRFQGLAASSHQKIQVGKKPLLAGYYISDWVSAFGVVLKGNEFI